MNKLLDKISLIKAYFKVLSESFRKDEDGTTCWKSTDDWKTDGYLLKFREELGYDINYWPDSKSYSQVASSIAREYALEQPFDTAAREIEGDAVMLLIRDGSEKSLKAAHKLGNALIGNNISKNRLLDLLQETYMALLHAHNFDAPN